jgi:hypothetical protein
MQNKEEKRRILFRTKVDKMYNKIRGTVGDIIAYLFAFIITLLAGIFFAHIAVSSTNIVATIIVAAAATFFLLLAVLSIMALIGTILYGINKNTIEIYIEDNKLVIKTLVPSKAINKYKTELFYVRGGYDNYKVLKNSITKTMVFDLPLRVRKVRFKIPDPQVHAVFDKYLITFLYYKTDDGMIISDGVINGFGYFYVLGLGFYPGLVYNLRFNCNGEYVHAPFYAIAYAEVICSVDVVFDGYLINDSYLIAGSEFDKIINGELANYVILEGGGEIQGDNINELVKDYIIKKYGLISEEELNSKEKNLKKPYSKKLEFADAVFRTYKLINNNMCIYIVVLDSNKNIIYRNNIENIDENEINKLSELDGKFAIEEVIGDKSKTFHIDKNKLIKRLKYILELKSRGELSMNNKLSIERILLLGF